MNLQRLNSRVAESTAKHDGVNAEHCFEVYRSKRLLCNLHCSATLYCTRLRSAQAPGALVTSQTMNVEPTELPSIPTFCWHRGSSDTRILTELLHVVFF